MIAATNMLALNLRNVIKDRGHQNPTAYLVKIGFTYYMASRLLNSKKKSINFAELEKICLELKCTPNDLLCYMPPPRTVLPQGHPLLNLRIEKNAGSIEDMLGQLPYDKLKEIREAITGIARSLKPKE